MSSLYKFYEEIKVKCKVSDIASKTISLTRKGGEYLGLCPFHTEKSPSFTINDIKGFYHCFGCGAHGDVIKFISDKYHLPYKDAAVKIAQEYGIEIRKLSKKEEEEYKELDILYSITETTNSFYRNNLKNDVIQYLEKRGIKKDIIEKFEIGYAPPGNALYKFLESQNYSLMLVSKAGVVAKDEQGNIYDVFRNRITFPIKNIYNKIVGFGARIIGDGLPKYINSPDNVLFHKKSTLYAENLAASNCYKTNNIIIVEGYFDVIAMHNIGLDQTVASLGTAVTKDHLIKIFKMVDEIIICMDGDKAGINAAKKLIDNVIDLISTKKQISFVIIPDSLDPDNLIKRDGAEMMKQLISKRLSLSNMIFKMELEKIDSYSPENRSVLEKSLDDLMSKINDTYIKKNFGNYFKNQIWEVFNKNKKSRNQTKMRILVPDLVSNISIIEKTMICCIIKNPIVLEQTNILNFLAEITLEKMDLEDLKSWIINQAEMHSTIISTKLVELLNKSSFKNLIESLLQDSFIVPNFEGDKSKTIDFFEVLQMKHSLVKIQQEYFNIMSNGQLIDSKLLKGYEDEIYRLVKQIDVVSNKILMN